MFFSNLGAVGSKAAGEQPLFLTSLAASIWSQRSRKTFSVLNNQVVSFRAGTKNKHGGQSANEK